MNIRSIPMQLQQVKVPHLPYYTNSSTPQNMTQTHPRSDDSSVGTQSRENTANPQRNERRRSPTTFVPGISARPKQLQNPLLLQEVKEELKKGNAATQTEGTTTPLASARNTASSKKRTCYGVQKGNILIILQEQIIIEIIVVQNLQQSKIKFSIAIYDLMLFDKHE